MSEKAHKRFIKASDEMLGRLEDDPLLDKLGLEIVDENESVTLKTPSSTHGIQAFWVARGGHIDSSRLTTRTFDLPRDVIGFNINEFTDNLTDEKVNEITDYGFESLRNEIVLRSLAVIQAAAPPKGVSYDIRAEAMLAQQTKDPGSVMVIGSLAGLTGTRRSLAYRCALSGLLAEGLPDNKIWGVNRDCFNLKIWRSKGKVYDEVEGVYDEVEGEYTHWLHKIDIGIALMAPSLKMKT